MKTIVLSPTPDGCKDELAGLRGSYVDGPLVAAVLDLSEMAGRYEAPARATRLHKKSIAYPIRRACREGYTTREFGGTLRNPEIEAINTSLPIRQGRRMGEGYWSAMSATPGDDEQPRPRPCPLHYRRMFGCFSKDDVLVAYVSWVKTDALGITSRILGHGAHLQNGVMHQLLGFVLTEAFDEGTRYVLYGSINDGHEGLKTFKRRWGWEPAKLVTA